MRVRRATTLVVTWHDNSAVIHNYLGRTRVAANGPALDLLAIAEDYVPLDELIAQIGSRDMTATDDEPLHVLLRAGVLLREGSQEDTDDKLWAKQWPWGHVAGFYHFANRDMEFLPPEAQRKFIRERRAERLSPPLLSDNAALPKVALPEPEDDAFWNVLAARESCRRYTDEPVPLQALADTLLFANGLRKVDEVEDFGTLPKTFTPSGGARNPYELFVHALRIEALESGIYHYSALDHDLGRIQNTPLRPASCLGGQEWTDGAAGVVYLQANFTRTAWKYHQSNAYRVVLMEAGFIAQNFLLSLTRHGVGGVPIGALAESRIERMLGVGGADQSVVLGVPFGIPALT